MIFDELHFTLSDWMRWQAWTHDTCLTCKHYDKSDYSCRLGECFGKEEKHEQHDED